jgi:hypothetical protein
MFEDFLSKKFVKCFKTSENLEGVKKTILPLYSSYFSAAFATERYIWTNRGANISLIVLPSTKSSYS